jgi:hypothetical protein
MSKIKFLNEDPLRDHVAELILSEDQPSDWRENDEVSSDRLIVRCVKRHGGSEGSGEDFWLVWSATDLQGNITYWRIDGYYASYDGAYAEIGDLHQVNKTPRLVDFYEQKSKGKISRINCR